MVAGSENLAEQVVFVRDVLGRRRWESIGDSVSEPRAGRGPVAGFANHHNGADFI